VLVAVWVNQVKPLSDQLEARKMVESRGGSCFARSVEGAFWQRWLLEPEAFQEVYTIQLDGVELKADDAVKLAGMKHLKNLTLQRSNFSDTDMAALSNIKGLKELSLRYCPITDAGIKQLGQKPELKILKLTGCDITDDSVAQLSTCSNLKHLYIRWTQISAEGVEQLRQQTPDCEIYYSPRNWR